MILSFYAVKEQELESLKSSIPIGTLIFTDKGKILLNDSSNNFINMSDVILVNSFADISPIKQVGKLYITNNGDVFTYDGNIVNKINKDNQVLFDYEDLNDLMTKNPAKENILYLTRDNKVYTYSNLTYVQVSGGLDASAIISLILDDVGISTQKTFSSSKILELLNNYVLGENVFTKTESNQLYSLKEKEHSHSNLQTLNEISEDANGDLLYKNRKVISDFTPFYFEQFWTNETLPNLTQLVSIKDIYTTNNYIFIFKSELTIENKSSIENLDLEILDNNIKIMSTSIGPNDVQKYELGISTNMILKVKGTFSANLYIGSF